MPSLSSGDHLLLFGILKILVHDVKVGLVDVNGDVLVVVIAVIVMIC